MPKLSKALTTLRTAIATGRTQGDATMVCDQLIDCRIKNGRHIDIECGKPATHWIFSGSPICQEHLDDYLRNSDWNEDELDPRLILRGDDHE